MNGTTENGTTENGTAVQIAPTMFPINDTITSLPSQPLPSLQPIKKPNKRANRRAYDSPTCSVMKSYIRGLRINVTYARGKTSVKHGSVEGFTFTDYPYLQTRNFTIAQLKELLAANMQPISGNKEDLTNRAFNYMRLGAYVQTIQSNVRGNFVRRYNRAKGIDRRIPDCVNDTDLISMDPIGSIAYKDFVGYRDEKGLMFGFELSTVMKLLEMSRRQGHCLNPYTRVKFTDDIAERVARIVRLSKLVGHGDLTIERNLDELLKLTDAEKNRRRIVAFCQVMDGYGNYTDTEWFLSMRRRHLVQFAKSLYDIWMFRSQMSQTMRRQIYPQNGGRPFEDFPWQNMRVEQIEHDTDIVRNIAFTMIEKLIGSGETDDDRVIGAMYVLTAVTLVNRSAAEALPALYYSVA